MPQQRSPAPSGAAPRPLPASVWVALGALAEAGYLAWALPAGARVSYGARLALYLLLFVPSVAAAALARRRPVAGTDLRWALGLAALFRLTLLPAPPVLSDDVYRYVWDGEVQAHGINPYRYAPSDPALAPLRGALHSRINHPDVPTLYPPLSQMVFAVAALLSGTVMGVKALMVAAEIACWVALVRIWRRRGLPLFGLLLYLWNPLVVIEGSGSGHNDALGVGLLLCASVLIILGRPGLSIAAWSASVGAKLFPLLTLPIWLRAVPRRFWALPPLVWLALWAPYLGAGPRLWAGLDTYGRHWESNAFLFRYLREAVARADAKPWLDRQWGQLCAHVGRADLASWIWPYTEPRQIAKALVALGLGVAILAWTRRRGDPAWATFRVLGLALLWAPTLNPWYLQWVLPFAAGYGSASWFVFSASVFLAYAPVGWGALADETLLWMEYAPFIVVWIGEELRRRRAGSRPAGPETSVPPAA